MPSRIPATTTAYSATSAPRPAGIARYFPLKKSRLDGASGGAGRSAAGPVLAAAGRLKYARKSQCPHGSQPSGASRSVTSPRTFALFATSRRYSHRIAAPGARRLTNIPVDPFDLPALAAAT
ncbi:hypothetical protein [Streptomyces sp. A5-4]|uniref:hypothetical protein n=1 Tax=Streptomyces sp. A5-4 TaxID=3384771 RepID=UPI003DAA1991